MVRFRVQPWPKLREVRMRCGLHSSSK